MSRLVRLTLALAASLAVACGEKAAETPARVGGHLYTDAQSGVGLDLPSVWQGRYRVGDSVTTTTAGLERELAFRFVRADSTLVNEPLIVVRVFKTAAWNKIPADAAGGLFGTVIASDASHTVAVRTAAGNPLAQGTADALAYDSLMMVVLQRPMRASLRP
ncbi:MAG: hypothetical protein K8S21_06200 [Gemmatimonadetes bacterium]|nr:hypothetical protein [Gemmatimonadota bacterium]